MRSASWGEQGLEHVVCRPGPKRVSTEASWVVRFSVNSFFYLFGLREPGVVADLYCGSTPGRRDTARGGGRRSLGKLLCAASDRATSQSGRLLAAASSAPRLGAGWMPVVAERLIRPKALRSRLSHVAQLGGSWR